MAATSSMIVDNCLQIFGGYGFIEEYPIAMATGMIASTEYGKAPTK